MKLMDKIKDLFMDEVVDDDEIELEEEEREEYREPVKEKVLPKVMRETIEEEEKIELRAKPEEFVKETREEIKEELRSGKSFCELARKHHVSDNAYRKWCRNLNLPDSPAVIKRIPIAEWDYACEHWEEVKDRYGNKQQNVRVSEQEKKLLKRLYCKEKRSVSEIAQIIKRDPGTVKKYLRQAGVEIV